MGSLARLDVIGSAFRGSRMIYLVTGAAGFIGYHCCRALLERGDTVVGLDNLNSYYSVALKRARLDGLRSFRRFTFLEIDVADRQALEQGLAGVAVERVIHLAAQPGVRHSLTNPDAYVSANLVGHLNLLEYCRHAQRPPSVVYASSSSVYGGNTKLPHSEHDRVDRPVSLYAATKRADELMSHAYAHLYGLSLTGLRFFTVYGPWGRPDMAVWLFADAILSGNPIQVFNHGRMRRDFTYIDDIVAGVLAVSDRPPAGSPPHSIYNLGGSRPEDLLNLIALLETALGRRAEKEFLPMQPGDIAETYADITAIARDYGFRPTTPIEVGIPKFVEWFAAWRMRS
jgi:UDP-glucuronate 4-epimerase